MSDEEKEERSIEVYKLMVAENTATVFATALCVGLVAIGTGSLHCLWGLLILLNITFFKKKDI